MQDRIPCHFTPLKAHWPWIAQANTLMRTRLQPGLSGQENSFSPRCLQAVETDRVALLGLRVTSFHPIAPQRG